MEFKNKLAFNVFLIILLTLIIGGYFATNYFIDNFEMKEENLITEIKDIRKNKEEDYIFFENEENIISALELTKKDIVINFGDYAQIENDLNKKMSEYSSQITYLKDVTIEEGTEIWENDEGIYSLSYLDYNTLTYDNNISLIVREYSYDIVNLSKGLNVVTYNFDKISGDIITEDEILNSFNISIEEVMNLIKEKLKTDNLIEEIIDIDATMNNMNYGVTINKTGELEILFLVKSTKLDYYDKLLIN